MTTRKGPDRVAILNADGTFDDPKVYEKLGEHFGELSEETIQDVEDLKTLTEEGRLSEPSLNATYGTLSAAALRKAARTIGAPGRVPSPTVTTDTPTVTWSASATVSAAICGPLDPRIRIIGRQGTWNPTFGYLDVSGLYSGLDFYLDGDTVEVGFTENTANGSKFWIWVDDEPVTAAPIDVGMVTASGTNYWVKMVFGSSARRRITIHTSRMKAWIDVRSAVGAAISPAPAKGLLAVVGDSFSAGSGGTPDLFALGLTLSRVLDMEFIPAAIGGTGYVAGSETFGSPGRLATITERTPDVIVVIGSLNDDAQPGIQAAATATFSAYAAACPNAPVVVFGPQPSNATDTIAANRLANNKAVKAAALAAANVIAYHDLVGGVDEVSLSAWSSGTTYNDGAIVTYKGSVYRLVNPGGTSLNQTPGGQRRWTLITAAFTGTGKVGTTASDGTRDTLLYSDGVHPTSAGSAALVGVIETALRSTLATL